MENPLPPKRVTVIGSVNAQLQFFDGIRVDGKSEYH